MATRQATAQATQTPRQMLQDRGANATRRLRELLDLPTDLTDLSLLSTALAEVATEEGGRNRQFASAVRKRYDELTALRGQPTKRGSRPAKEPLPPLVPIGRVPGRAIDPYAPPDPHFLTQVYGRHQLARALQDYSRDTLKRTAAELEQRHPGTKPASRSLKDALIVYIVEQSAKE